MSEPETPIGSTKHRDGTPDDRGRLLRPNEAVAPGVGGRRRFRLAPMVAGCVACVFAVAFLVGGGWALWKDRADRDANGFVTFGTSDLETSTSAIVGDLSGDGPGWLWGSRVLGDTRVRATSQSDRPLFIGIARSEKVFKYIGSAGYATIDSFDVTADTTHAGGSISGPPSDESIWAASTQGTGQQTLRWTPRSGDWSVVFMNADASAAVAVHGDAGAELPILPWVAGVLLVLGGALGFVGVLLLLRATRQPRPMPIPSQPTSPRTPAGTAN